MNINCLPSKNEIWSAKVADLVHHAANFGAMTGSVATDMAKVRQRKRDMVEGMIPMTLQQYNASGAELIMGVSKEARAFQLTPWSQIRGRFHRRYGNNFR